MVVVGNLKFRKTIDHGKSGIRDTGRHDHLAFATVSPENVDAHTMSLLVLSAQDHVDAVVSELPNDLVALMASVKFHRLSSRSAYASPHRTSISVARHTALFMPSRVPDLGTTIKVVLSQKFGKGCPPPPSS